ncbi:MAG TPA: class II aldolase/adducin family protein [Myxococcota bacterium]|jgi:L-fuculose-phosphate aldolase|nr:class II aldolase/adducin family protein [Myxococcota bacterium]
MSSEETLRAELVTTARQLHASGWVANHDGNVSARLGDHFLATPTSMSKGAVSAEMLIVVDGEGELVSGTRKGFSELKLHLAAYRIRPDVHCVIHAHPPTATGFAVAQVELGPPFMAEPVVSLGRRIPLVPFSMEPDLQELEEADALMLANHGVLTVGPDLETALLRMELVEHLAKIALVARQLGGPVALPEDLVAQLHEKHEGIFEREADSPAESTWTRRSGSATSIVADALKRHS